MKDRRYSIKQSLTGKLIVMVSYREPSDSPEMFYWTSFRPAGQEELMEVTQLLSAKGK